MASSNMGFDEVFSDAQDITDAPIITASAEKQSKRAKSRKQKKVIDEELGLLRGIKKAVEELKPTNDSHDRSKEKKYGAEKDRDATQAGILKNLDILVKLAKAGKLGGGKGGEGFSPDINIGGKDKKHKKKKIKEGIDDFYSREAARSAERDAAKTAAKKSLLRKGLSIGGRALPFVGAGVGALALSSSLSGSSGRGSILESALSGGMMGGEAGAIFDGVGAIPGAIAGALLGAGSEFAKEYKDKLNPALDDFSADVKDVVGGILSVLGNATSFIEKHLPTMDSLKKDWNTVVDDVKPVIQTTVRDTGTVIGATQHAINRSADSALKSSGGTRESFNPDVERAINSITTGPDGLDRDYTVAVAQAESRGGAARDALKNGKNTSSAKGLFQFTGPTAAYLSKKYGIDISDIYNYDTQARLFKANTRENEAAFRKAYNRDPTHHEAYLSAFLGAGGAVKMLNANAQNPNAIAAQVDPSAYNSNQSAFQDKQGRQYTTKEFIDKFYAYYDKSLKDGLAAEANARKKFGMKDDGSVTSFKDEVKPVITDIKDGGKRIANAMDTAANNIVSEAKADTTRDGIQSTTNEQVKVTAKRPKKRVKEDWFHREMPRTAGNVDNIKGVGFSLFNGIIKGQGYVHSDFTGGDRGFVNREAYTKANQGAVNWLRTGSYATPSTNKDDGIVNQSRDSNTPSDSQASVKVSNTSDVSSREATSTPNANSDTSGFSGRSPVVPVSKAPEPVKHNDQTIREKPSVKNAQSKAGSGMTPSQAAISLDDVPMFLQDSGIIVINSGRGV